MSKRKQARKPKVIRDRQFRPVVLVDDIVADRVMEQVSSMSLPEVVSDTPDTPPEATQIPSKHEDEASAKPVADVWLLHKVTSLTSIIVRRESDGEIARCRVRNSSKYRRNVPVNIVGTVATGLYEGKPPVVKRVEVAS